VAGSTVTRRCSRSARGTSEIQRLLLAARFRHAGRALAMPAGRYAILGDERRADRHRGVQKRARPDGLALLQRRADERAAPPSRDDDVIVDGDWRPVRLGRHHAHHMLVVAEDTRLAGEPPTACRSRRRGTRDAPGLPLPSFKRITCHRSTPRPRSRSSSWAVHAGAEDRTSAI